MPCFLASAASCLAFKMAASLRASVTFFPTTERTVPEFAEGKGPHWPLIFPWFCRSASSRTFADRARVGPPASLRLHEQKGGKNNSMVARLSTLSLVYSLRCDKSLIETVIILDLEQLPPWRGTMSLVHPGNQILKVTVPAPDSPAIRATWPPRASPPSRSMASYRLLICE